MERIVDLSEEAAGLSVRHNQLVIRRNEQEVTLPLDELAVLVVSNPAVHYTQAVLSSLCTVGGIFILCNQKHLPIGMLLPLEGHFVQTERFAAQAEASLPLKKRLWKGIVRAKVTAQGNLLCALHGNDHGLLYLAKKVRSGDPANIEAQASRRYWPNLFEHRFHRDQARGGVNVLLNYGYAILRAVVARAICAAGLHPSLGLHHHNRYDAFCLADDIMEPFRPLVDAAVVDLVNDHGSDVRMEKQVKGELIEAVAIRRFTVDSESRTLFDIMARVASSLVHVYAGRAKKLLLPELR